ncbi:unnamed protein product [Amoebophrya sp. A120]|nr:unnamed protein product [Amoebophrya sp. A120]|eukprot:GSA120T00011745001.1
MKAFGFFGAALVSVANGAAPYFHPSDWNVAFSSSPTGDSSASAGPSSSYLGSDTPAGFQPGIPLAPTKEQPRRRRRSSSSTSSRSITSRSPAPRRTFPSTPPQTPSSKNGVARWPATPTRNQVARSPQQPSGRAVRFAASSRTPSPSTTRVFDATGSPVGPPRQSTTKTARALNSPGSPVTPQQTRSGTARAFNSAGSPVVPGAPSFFSTGRSLLPPQTPFGPRPEPRVPDTPGATNDSPGGLDQVEEVKDFYNRLADRDDYFLGNPQNPNAVSFTDEHPEPFRVAAEYQMRKCVRMVLKDATHELLWLQKHNARFSPFSVHEEGSLHQKGNGPEVLFEQEQERKRSAIRNLKKGLQGCVSLVLHKFWQARFQLEWKTEIYKFAKTLAKEGGAKVYESIVTTNKEVGVSHCAVTGREIPVYREILKLTLVPAGSFLADADPKKNHAVSIELRDEEDYATWKNIRDIESEAAFLKEFQTATPVFGRSSERSGAVGRGPGRTLLDGEPRAFGNCEWAGGESNEGRKGGNYMKLLYNPALQAVTRFLQTEFLAVAEEFRTEVQTLDEQDLPKLETLETLDEVLSWIEHVLLRQRRIRGVFDRKWLVAAKAFEVRRLRALPLLLRKAYRNRKQPNGVPANLERHLHWRKWNRGNTLDTETAFDSADYQNYRVRRPHPNGYNAQTDNGRLGNHWFLWDPRPAAKAAPLLLPAIGNAGPFAVPDAPLAWGVDSLHGDATDLYSDNLNRETGLTLATLGLQDDNDLAAFVRELSTNSRSEEASESSTSDAVVLPDRQPMAPAPAPLQPMGFRFHLPPFMGAGPPGAVPWVLAAGDLPPPPLVAPAGDGEEQPGDIAHIFGGGANNMAALQQFLGFNNRPPPPVAEAVTAVPEEQLLPVQAEEGPDEITNIQP